MIYFDFTLLNLKTVIYLFFLTFLFKWINKFIFNFFLGRILTSIIPSISVWTVGQVLQEKTSHMYTLFLFFWLIDSYVYT